MYDESYVRLLAYALGYVNRANAEEIVSETFLIAWRRLDSGLDTVPSRELPWLFGVARNLIRERYRADQRLRTLCADLGAEAHTGHVDDIAEHVTDRAAALQALAELPDADRELLTLLAWHGLSNSDAAKVLGCSTATLVVRVHRARRRLRAAMAPPDEVSAQPLREQPIALQQEIS
jgi:RNA polymerase sigma-70 factor (ECF subfamily)